MDPHDVVTAWRRHYGSSAPAGYLLRGQWEREWLRFHTLPGHERVPADEQARGTVLERLNAIAAAVLGEGAAVGLLVSEVGDVSAAVEKLSPALDRLTILPTDWVTAFDEYVDTSSLALWAGARIFRPGSVDDLLLARAQDDLATLTLFSMSQGDALCPYDGGVDLFVRDAQKRDSLMSMFRAWLPPRLHS